METVIQKLDACGWKAYMRLWDALKLKKEEPGILSVVGAGGKTTVIRRLRLECLENNVPHIVSTTTHMQIGPQECFVREPDLTQIEKLLKTQKSVWMGIPVSEEKMGSFSSDFLKDVENFYAWMFLEADGAKCLPVKAPRSTEPVILPETTHVLNVYGMDGIGKPIADVCCRPEKVADILQKKPSEILTWEDIATLALSSEGGRKSVLNEMEYHVILNKADTKERQTMAKKIAEKIYEEHSVDGVYVTANLLKRK